MSKRTVLSALNDKPLYVRAYEAIKLAILSGRIRPGSRLNQVELADQLQVSRAPVLDALARLASEGLVKHSPRIGYSVNEFTVKDVANLYSVRCALECQAMEEMYDRVTQEQITEMRLMLTDSYSELEKGDIKPYVVVDAEFHARLIELSDNSVLMSMLTQLTDQIQLIRVMVAISQTRVMRAAAEHIEILSCLENHEVEKGKAILRHHIDSVKYEVMDQLKKRIG